MNGACAIPTQTQTQILLDGLNKSCGFVATAASYCGIWRDKDGYVIMENGVDDMKRQQF
jgi:hypothetical protein